MTASPPTDAAPPGVADQAGGTDPPSPRPGSHRAERSPIALLLPALVVAVSVLAVGVGVYGWVGALNGTQAAPDVPLALSTPAPSTTPGAGHSAAPSPSRSTQPSASASPSHSPKPSHSASATSSPKASHSAAVARDYPVVVLNQTSVTGLAAATAADLRRLGWTVTGVSNWRGDVTETTVYYPPGHEAQAEQLARDLHVDRVRPRSAPMRSDRLTVILAGRQG